MANKFIPFATLLRPVFCTLPLLSMPEVFQLGAGVLSHHEIRDEGESNGRLIEGQEARRPCRLQLVLRQMNFREKYKLSMYLSLQRYSVGVHQFEGVFKMILQPTTPGVFWWHRQLPKAESALIVAQTGERAKQGGAQYSAYFPRTVWQMGQGH